MIVWLRSHTRLWNHFCEWCPWQRDVGRVVLDGESMRRPTSSTDPPCEVGTEVQLLKILDKNIFILVPHHFHGHRSNTWVRYPVNKYLAKYKFKLLSRLELTIFVEGQSETWSENVYRSDKPTNERWSKQYFEVNQIHLPLLTVI